MKRTRFALSLCAALVAAAPAWAASPFDGTWKTDLTKVKFAEKPDEILLAKGIYACKTCTPAITVPADGRFHPVTGHDYYDAVAVKVVSPLVVEMTAQKGGETVFVNRATISADGKTMEMASKRTNLATGVASTMTGTSTRVGARPAGAHAASGTWMASKANSASASAITQTIKVVGSAMTISTPSGEGYTATFGGPAVMQKNDVGKTMITLEKVADNHVIETDTRGGKPVMVYDMLVAPDGKTMTMKVIDKRSGSADILLLDKI